MLAVTKNVSVYKIECFSKNKGVTKHVGVSKRFKVVPDAKNERD